MKYFNPSYWFKLWILSAPLFNSENQGIYAKSIHNQKIKDWANKNTSDISLLENQELSLSNNQTIQLQNNENIQSIKNLETDHFYENFLKTQGWSRDPQIAQQQLQEIEEEHHQFLKAQHKRFKIEKKKREIRGMRLILENGIYSLVNVNEENLKITAIKIIDENTKGGNFKPGDIYIGTTKGLYCFTEGKYINKFDNLDFIITSITLDGNGSAYVTNVQNEIYHLNLVGWGSKKLENIESSNLNKEIKLYYENDKKNLTRHLTAKMNHYNNNQYITLNLGKINPLNYQKINFLGDTGSKVKWGDWIYENRVGSHCTSGDNTYKCYATSMSIPFISNINEWYNFFHHIIENNKNSISDSKTITLIKGKDRYRNAVVEYNQRFGLTWYWENDNYYLQMHTLQYCNWWASFSDLDCWIKIGNGIQLYNDEQYVFLTSQEREKIFIKIKNEIEQEIQNRKNEREKSIKQKIKDMEKKELEKLEIEKRKSEGDWLSQFIRFMCTSDKYLPDSSQGVSNTIKECINAPEAGIIPVGGNYHGNNLGEKIAITGLKFGNAVQSGTAYGGQKVFNGKRKREIFDINNLEEKNITKWTNEFTKSINYEQHLPINNKTNFSTNNITSL